MFCILGEIPDRVQRSHQYKTGNEREILKVINIANQQINNEIGGLVLADIDDETRIINTRAIFDNEYNEILVNIPKYYKKTLSILLTTKHFVSLKL